MPSFPACGVYTDSLTSSKQLELATRDKRLSEDGDGDQANRALRHASDSLRSQSERTCSFASDTRHAECHALAGPSPHPASIAFLLVRIFVCKLALSSVRLALRERPQRYTGTIRQRLLRRLRSAHSLPLGGEDIFLRVRIASLTLLLEECAGGSKDGRCCFVGARGGKPSWRKEQE